MRSADEIFAGLTGAVPGAALLVRENGLARSRAFGRANLETGEPCTAETNFRLASVSKQFTALAVVLLAAAGQISLDDSVARWLPELPSWGAAMTLRHLLAHRSGLVDYEELIPPAATAQLKDRDVLELVRRQRVTLFAPGAKFRYSNGGYALLALIVERASGKRFANFLHDTIFAPLGMSGTVAFEDGISTVPHRALGYRRQGMGFEPADQTVTSAVLGDGGIYSSVADLSLWLEALAAGRLVERSWWRQIFGISSPATDFAGSGYGFGWYLEGGRAWHYGETCGFSSWLEFQPETGQGAAILTNCHGIEFAAELSPPPVL